MTPCLWHHQMHYIALVNAGWEPFAVTVDDDGTTVWLRIREPDLGTSP